MFKFYRFPLALKFIHIVSKGGLNDVSLIIQEITVYRLNAFA